VGEDGATHHGIFDLAYLRCIPNMIIYAPINELELQHILYTAQLGLNHPIAIRYPRGRGIHVDWKTNYEKIEIGRAKCLKKGTEVAVLSNGTIGNNVIKALANIKNPDAVAHYDFAFVKPLDEKSLHAVFAAFQTIITIEDGVINGGFGTAILEFAALHQYSSKIQILGIPDEFIEQGTVTELQQYCKIDVKSLEILFSTY
jgi:1-deoxy-D-xylulose-5-phosphate synthase